MADNQGEAAPADQTSSGTGEQGVVLGAALFTNAAYLKLLPLCALLGVAVSALGYGFVVLVGHLQLWLYDSAPGALGYKVAPVWWPLPMLVAGGLLVGLSLRLLPGNGGHSPADGFTPAPPEIRDLPSIVLAALASLGFGAVLGPEAPLIAIGGGMGALAVRYLAPRTQPALGPAVGVAGAVAALGTIFGSPLLAAMFVMEAIGLGGELLTAVIVPALLAAGLGALVFVGLGHFTGVGAASLVLPHLPHFSRPTLAEVGWSLLLGLAAALLCWGVRSAALVVRGLLRRLVVVGPVLAGLVVGLTALVFAESTGRPVTDLVFSGQAFIGPLIEQHASWTLGALALLLVCKAVAYAVSLSSFRGGPVFPALFLGAAGGLLASHLPGMGLVAGIAAGMGAMTAAMLSLPVASVLLPSLLLFDSGVAVTPLVILAVVASFLTTKFLPLPQPRDAREKATTAAQPAPA